ncbi:MAG: Clp protease N-terminal domain-containing protein [Trebonia sp.]
MLHEGAWPVRAFAGLVDPERAEAAIIAAMRAPDYSPPAQPAWPFERGYVETWGGKIAAEMGDSYIGAEHAFLEIIRDQRTLPARVLAGLASLPEIEAAVLAVKDAPPHAPDSAAFLPDGQVLDEDLRVAVMRHLPEGTTFGFNWLDGRPWIDMMSPGTADAARSQSVLNAALASLGRA